MAIQAFVADTNRDLKILVNKTSVYPNDAINRMISVACKVVGLLLGLGGLSMLLKGFFAASALRIVLGAFLGVVAFDTMIFGKNISSALHLPVDPQSVALSAIRATSIAARSLLLRAQRRTEAEGLMDGMILVPAIYSWFK